MEALSKRLARSLKQAEAKLDDLKAARNLRRQKLLAERVAPLEQQVMALKREIDRMIYDEFPFANFDAIESEIRQTKKALDEAKVAESTMSRALVGTTVQQWTRGRYGTAKELKPKDIGIVAVFDGTNVGRGSMWNKPRNVGDLFIRNIKKDGTPGLTSLATVPEDTLPGGWYPVGVDPNKQTNV